jgi:glyoxylase-like metal-dependent hydrolase (beta-lactamase superfamily II)
VIQKETHGDVSRYDLTSWRSRTLRFSVSVYAVRGALIDTGFPCVRREVRALVEELRPRGALVTHHHEDHAGNALLLAGLKVPMAIPGATEAAIRTPVSIGLYRRYTWGSALPLTGPVEPFDTDDLRLIAAPGHSVDHHVVWDEMEGTLFSADLFLGVKVQAAFVTEDPRAHVRSLRAAVALAPRRMFDAHRGAIPSPVSALSAKANWMEDLIGAVDRRIAAGEDDEPIQRALVRGSWLRDVFSGGDYSAINLVRAIRKTGARSEG